MWLRGLLGCWFTVLLHWEMAGTEQPLCSQFTVRSTLDSIGSDDGHVLAARHPGVFCVHCNSLRFQWKCELTRRIYKQLQTEAKSNICDFILNNPKNYIEMYFFTSFGILWHCFSAIFILMMWFLLFNLGNDFTRQRLLVWPTVLFECLHAALHI